MSTIKAMLKGLYQDRVLTPASVDEIPRDVYLVYILDQNGKALVVGHGQKNRAKVIFDDLNRITNNHIKAIFVRLHHLDAGASTQFGRYVITCTDKKNAQAVEAEVHKKIQGNRREISESIKKLLFSDLPDQSVTKTLLSIAIASAFDGLSDLKNWRKKGIIDDPTWETISKKLRLDEVVCRSHHRPIPPRIERDRDNVRKFRHSEDNNTQ